MATAVVITGASRGFGRAAAIALTAELAATQKRTDLFLWARNAEKLQDTERAVHATAKKFDASAQTFSSSVDLGNQASYVGHVESLVQQLQGHEPPYETIYVVHNAASVGQLGCTDVWASATDLADYWELNLTHVCFFNARLLAAFKHLHSTRLVLANVSSGLATRALAGSGLYCTGKAAREMHFRVIAEENKQTNRVRVVNYSPGAMDTEMQDEIRESTATPEATRAMFMGYKKNGQLVRAEDSALYCSQVIVEDTYESGSTVSYDRSKLVAREGLFDTRESHSSSGDEVARSMATAVVVTGASRGFGRAIATVLAKDLAAKQQRVDMYLWARDAEKLQDTERAVHAAAKEYKGNVQTFSSSVDLGSQASYVGHVESLVQKSQAHEPPYETIYVIHNAASVGQLGCTDVWASATDLADYWELNLTHVCFFNARLLAALKHLHTTRLVLVNVSSAAATLAVGGMGLYCTAKAAREMHFRVIAEEYKGEKRVRVLNYAPGAMDTDMQTELRASTATPETTQALFKAFKEEGQLVRAEDSALTCAQILMEDAYETGSTIVFDPSKARGS